jgi:hypothetical protein
MATKEFHVSNLGSFGGGLVTDSAGYVTIHDSKRYAAATTEQLRDWAENGRTQAIRNAAQCELNERAIRNWQNGNG